MTTTKAQTTRPVTFSITDADTVVRTIVTLPAGTDVYARPARRDGFLKVRVCGSLLSQIVSVDSVRVA